MKRFSCYCCEIGIMNYEEMMNAPPDVTDFMSISNGEHQKNDTAPFRWEISRLRATTENEYILFLTGMPPRSR